MGKKNLNSSPAQKKGGGNVVNPMERKEDFLVIRDGDKPLKLHLRTISGIKVYTDEEEEKPGKHAGQVRHDQEKSLKSHRR